jgi:Flp pilus assembly protein TadG
MLALVAFVMPVILLLCGLALDVGLLELKTLQLQNAAAAAALGAQLEAERGTNHWLAQGQADAALNGFTNGVNNVTVTIVQQPSSGAFAGDYDALQATVTQSVSTSIMGAFTGGTVTLSAQAVSLLTPCVYLTGTNALQSYSLEVANGSLLGNSCPIYVNTGMNVQSAGQMAVDAINVTGSAGASSNPGFVYPSPVFNVRTISDPLASTTSPSFSGTCNHSGFSLSSATATLNPGTYCNGMNFSSSTVTLNPGLYVITGGANWSGSTVTGSGVTLFFTKGGGGSYGQFWFHYYSTVNLSAPNDSSNGGIPGILVFADRNWVPTAAQDFKCANTTFQGDGIWYLSNAGMQFTSCHTFQGTNYFGIVADNIEAAGTIVYPTNNYSNVPTGNPFRPLGGLVQ